MRVLVCDVDNTLVDTATEWVRRFGAPADPADYYAYVPLGYDFASADALRAYRDAAPIKGAPEAVRKLAGAGWFVVYATSRSKAARGVTWRWLRRNGFPMVRLRCGPEAKRKATLDFSPIRHTVVYVDDTPEQDVAYGTIILPHRRPWRPEGLSWPEILRELA